MERDESMVDKLKDLLQNDRNDSKSNSQTFGRNSGMNSGRYKNSPKQDFNPPYLMNKPTNQNERRDRSRSRSNIGYKQTKQY